MAAYDYITAVYTQVWAILEGHAPFAAMVKPGNRIKLTLGSLMPKKQRKQDADFPEALLMLGDAFADSGFTLAPRYDYYLASGFVPQADDWPEEIEQYYVLTLTGRDMRIDSSDPLEMEAMTALRKAGPRLSLPYVCKWGPITGRRSIGLTGESDGTLRVQTALSIPVVMRLRGNTLLI